jgi:hypothetical protein|eukprot:g5108.t1
MRITTTAVVLVASVALSVVVEGVRDEPVLSMTKPKAGGRGKYVPWVNFDDTQYEKDYFKSARDGVVTEVKFPSSGELVKPVEVAASVSPAAAAQKAVSRPAAKRPQAPSLPKKKGKPTPATPALRKPKPPANPEMAELEAKKNAAEQITKTMDAYAKKVREQNAVDLAKVPDSAKAQLNNKESKKTELKVATEMAAKGGSAADNVKRMEQDATPRDGDE